MRISASHGMESVKAGGRRLFSPELENQFVYFVHSYYVPINEFTAAVQTIFTLLVLLYIKIISMLHNFTLRRVG